MPTLWLPPKVWFQGSQSMSTGRSSVRIGIDCRICCWLAHHMRWVLMTAFGSLVEPLVNRNLTMVSGVVACCAASTAGVGSVASSSDSSVAFRPFRFGWSAWRETAISQSVGAVAASAGP